MMKLSTRLLILLTVICMLAAMTACGAGSAGSSAAEASALSSGEAAAPEESAASEAAAPAETPSEPEEPASETASSAEEELPPEASEEEAAPQPPELDIRLPLNDDSVSISYWMSWNPDLSAVCAPGDASVYRKMEEDTGIHVEYIESSPFNFGQDFDLMIASGDYVDVFPASGTLSVDQAYEQGISIDLTDYMDTYLWHYNQILNSDDVYLQAARNSDGQYLGVISMYDENVPVNCGLVIRKDWLDQLGMDMPETYDDYHEVLTAFKNQIGARSPMHLGSYGVLNGNYFCSGFGINGYISNMEAPFYQVDGEVRFGPVQPEFRDYLTLISQWFSEGLIYSDFYSVMDPMTAPASEVTTENMGLWICELARMHEFDTQVDASGSFEIWPVQDAVQEAGGINPIRVAADMAGGGGDVIATTCEYPEIAALWLDYRYTEEGILLLNYGVEGEGFNYNDKGEPELSELITGADNINFGLAMYATVFLGYNKPERMWSTYTDAQMASLEVWKMGDNEYGYPSAPMTVEETEEYNRLFSDINTYLQSEVVKFVIGDRSLDEFDDYTETLKTMGLDTCVEIKQAAYDRYAG